jgi:hypothetical protein
MGFVFFSLELSLLALDLALTLVLFVEEDKGEGSPHVKVFRKTLVLLNITRRSDPPVSGAAKHVSIVSLILLHYLTLIFTPPIVMNLYFL